MRQGSEEGGRQRVEVDLRFTNNVACYKLRRVFIHMNEAVQLTQDVIGHMA